MRSVSVTGNTSGGEGYAVYLADSDYDGHSYFAGLMRMSGNMQIHDNVGGDLYLGKQVPVIFDEEGLTEAAKIDLVMHSGLLTQWIWGNYDYEGSDLSYTVTYGDRSVREPMYEEAAPEETIDPTEEVTDPTEQTQPEEKKENILIYAGLGAFIAVIAAAAVIVVLVNKKKAAAK